MGQAKQRGSATERLEQAQHGVQALNYAVHAIEDLRQGAAVHGDDGNPAKAESVRNLLDMAFKLKASEKFLLPMNGDLLDVSGMREDYFDLLRLPYPITALEFPTDPSRNGGAKKSVVLCWTGLDGIEETGEYEPDEGSEVIQFTLFYFSERQNAWRPTPCSFWFHRNHLELSGTVVSKGLGHRHLYPSLFDEYYRQCDGDIDALDDQIYLDMKAALDALIEFCLTINCENVEQSVLLPSEALNKRRQERGGEPFDTYRLLTIPGAAPGEGRGMGGSHASPKLHLRRGHLRRLATGKVTWVRHTLVGDVKKGVAEKTYKVASNG